MTAADEHPPHRPDEEDQGSGETSADEPGARPEGEPGDRPPHGDDTGAEGEGSADDLPPEPSEDDDTPLGDTDQHSVSDA